MAQDRVVVAEATTRGCGTALSVEAIAGDGAKFDAIALAALARQFHRRVKVPPGEDDRYAKFLKKRTKRSGRIRAASCPPGCGTASARSTAMTTDSRSRTPLLEAAFDLRVNTLKAKRDAILGRLQKEGFRTRAPRRCRQWESGCRNRVDISRHPLFETARSKCKTKAVNCWPTSSAPSAAKW